MRTRRAAAAIAAALLAAQASAPSALAGFNPQRILDDAVLRDGGAMSYADIRAFLASKGGLADVIDLDPADGLLKNGAQLVHDAARRHDVNPQYLLALIQKESSAVETDAPGPRQLDWATGYALCDGCYRTSGQAQLHKGFARQVEAGAAWMAWYYDQAAAGKALRQPGQATVISGTTLVPENVATAALYSYTPHLHGNLLLWNIWNRWFGDGTVGLRFPDGTLARDAKTGETSLVQGGRFRRITNASVLSSRFGAAVPVVLTHDVYEGLLLEKAGRPLQFPDFSLVRTENGVIYLLVGDRKRRVASPEAFARVGFNPEEVEDVLAADLADYADGEPIAADVTELVGELRQDAATGGVYYVVDGRKRPLLDRALLSTNFRGERIRRVAAAELAEVPTGDAVLFDDGVLAKAPDSPAVYVISGGTRRLLPSEDVFLALGYDWRSVVTASKRLLERHPLGEPVTIDALFDPAP